MRVLALDIGEKRIGIAHGDTVTKIAMPISTIDTREALSGSKHFRDLIQEYEPELLVAGLPISLDGQENSQAQRVREIAEFIAKMVELPLFYQDERLSSVEAKRYLRERGCTQREMRGRIDMVAASLILQTYLDSSQIEHPGDACL